MTDADQYVLGYREAEQRRLQQQARQLAHESRWLFDQAEIPRGARVVEIGCGPHGCLELLSERVGPSGSVVGIERSAEAVALARTLVSERSLGNVEVLEGDARHTGLARASFDLATARLVLVNVPHPEQIVEVRVNPIVHVYPPGRHAGRFTSLLSGMGTQSRIAELSMRYCSSDKDSTKHGYHSSDHRRARAGAGNRDPARPRSA